MRSRRQLPSLYRRRAAGDGALLGRLGFDAAFEGTSGEITVIVRAVEVTDLDG